jgi:hypothetical protein
MQKKQANRPQISDVVDYFVTSTVAQKRLFVIRVAVFLISRTFESYLGELGTDVYEWTHLTTKW